MNANELRAQRQYVERMVQEGFDFSLAVAGAFVRGMRDIGYKSTATALDELIDNSLQAGAENVRVAFGSQGSSDAKPTSLAVLDDGHGMEPTMIRLAAVWGGTHRENDRTGFGRYGYGLPSACASQGRRFSIYSRVEGGAFHRVTLDVDEIGQGNYSVDGRVVVPEPVPDELPRWISLWAKGQFGKNGESLRTAVVIEKLDRLSWKTETALTRNLVQHIGVTYRNFLRQCHIKVGDSDVQPVDPLFLMPEGRFYDLDDVRAEALDPLVIDIKEAGSGQPVGTVKVRFAYFPPSFTKGRVKGGEPGEKGNPRLTVMKEHNGIIVLRNGRQIDVLTRAFDQAFQNNDRYWAVEVDFPASLDDEFSINTSKQRVALSERVETYLEDHGVLRAIQEMRKRYDVERKRDANEAESNKDQKRASEQAMETAVKVQPPSPTSPERERRAGEEFVKEVNRRAEESGVDPESIEQQLLAETQGRPFKVELEHVPGGPFYRAIQRGGQTVLFLNTAHRFYIDVYAGPDTTPRLRYAMDVLLFVLGACELDTTGDRMLFYEAERSEWSRRLSVTLGALSQIVPPPVTGDDDAAA